MQSIDLNCDMGENMGNDAAILPFISSANVACGFHAGDENNMRQTIELCLKNNVAIGAHPSFFDKKNFGRTEMHLSAEQIYDLVILQLRVISKIAKEKKAKLHHVKPHGSLYNMSARDKLIAEAIANAIKDFDEELILYGLCGSVSLSVAQQLGLKTAGECFADRTYQDDGTLTSRSLPNALIENTEDATRQVLQMIKEKKVTTISGKKNTIAAETICIHGDGKHAVEFAKTIHQNLKENSIDIKTI